MKQLVDEDKIKELCYYQTEKDLCQIVSNLLANTIKENIEILKKLLPLKNKEVIEIGTLRIEKKKPNG